MSSLVYIGSLEQTETRQASRCFELVDVLRFSADFAFTDVHPKQSMQIFHKYVRTKVVKEEENGSMTVGTGIHSHFLNALLHPHQ